MAKRTMSIRLEPSDIEALQAKAEQDKKTVTDLITEGVYAQKSTIDLERQIEELKRQKAELQTKFERATGRKASMKRRVTISITEQEHQALTAAAEKSNMPKAALMRKMLTQAGNPVFRQPPPLEDAAPQNQKQPTPKR